jgi:hypothetical protein
MPPPAPPRGSSFVVSRLRSLSVLLTSEPAFRFFAFRTWWQKRQVVVGSGSSATLLDPSPLPASGLHSRRLPAVRPLSAPPRE